jgi:hypothetical protein
MREGESVNAATNVAVRKYMNARKVSHLFVADFSAPRTSAPVLDGSARLVPEVQT